MKFITCNIEGDRHFEERLFSFFAKEQPDVLCVQEVFESDVDLIKEKTGLSECFFAPQANVILPNDHLPLKGVWGVAIFATKIIDPESFYYYGHENDQLAVFENNHPEKIDRVVIATKVEVDEQTYQVATLHFTWSGKGNITELQQRDYLPVKQFLSKFDELILCGDFNTPRGEEIFDDLAKTYTDNIPQEIDTTIDKNLHKSGQDIRLVVDGLFTSENYLVSSVRVVPNTSDHMAVVAKVCKRK